MQLSIEYNQKNYDSLPKVESAKKNFIGCSDKISQLGEIISKYGYENKIGVSVLHKHFEISETERLVRISCESKILAKPSSATTNLAPCHWRLSNNESSASKFVPVEFLDANTFSEDALELASELKTSNGKLFLGEFGAKLIELDCSEQFGLMTLHAFAELETEKNSILYEESNDEQRTSEISSTVPSSEDYQEPFEALWIASSSMTDKIGVAMSCAYHCQCKTPPLKA